MAGILQRPTNAPEVEKPQTGFLGQLLQGGLDIGAMIGGLPGTVQQYTGFNPLNPAAIGSSPTIESLQQGLRKATGYQEPQSKAQRFGYNLGGNIPGAAASIATGGLSAIAPAALRSIGSALGETTAEELGFGPIGKAVGSLFGGISGAYGAKLGTRGIANKILPSQKESYSAARKLGEKLHVDGSETVDALSALEEPAKNALAGPLYNRYYKQFLHEVDGLRKSIKDGVLPVNKLTEAKRGLNEIIYDKSTPDRAQKFFVDARDTLLEGIKKIEIQHPEWGQQWRRGENLTTFIKGTENFKPFLAKHKDILTAMQNSSPEVIDLIGSFGKMTKPGFIKSVGKVVGYPFMKAGQEIPKSIELARNPATRELLGELWQGVAENSAPIAARSLIELNKMFEKKPTQSGGRLVKRAGGRLVKTQRTHQENLE